MVGGVYIMKRKIIPKQKYTTYASFPLASGDVRAYEIELDLGHDATGAEFKVVAIRADGKVIEDLGKVSDGVATYTLANSMYAVPGELTVRLQVLHDSSVLTDREIIFEVLEGIQNAAQGSTVVPLNDSVILRMSAIEDKLFGKVDKEAGKGLSSNDFTKEYKTKLDNLDEAIGSELERVSEDVDNLSDEVLQHKSDKANPHQVTASQVGAYTKAEVDARLSYKADKSDIVNACRFCGSAPTFDDLPFSYKLIPNGVPTKNGEVCGEYNSDSEGTEFEMRSFTIDTTVKEEDVINIPIEEIKIKKGLYIRDESVLGEEFGPLLVRFGNISVNCQHLNAVTLEEQTINCIKISSRYEGATIPFIIEGADNFGKLKRTTERWSEGFRVPEGAYDNGAVYNVLDTGMNYAWNGTEYDALGGEHKDLEARDDIESLEAQMGDVETALDNIIAIQNELIGGESE